MSGTARWYIEQSNPGVEIFGLNSKKAVDFSQSPSVELPANTTINGGVIGVAWGAITGTITEQSDLQSFVDSGVTHTKTLTNNTANSLFTFPLASGEGVGITFNFTIFIKKGSDYAIAHAIWPLVFYNNGGSLVFSKTDADLLDVSGGTSITGSNKNNGGSVTETHLDISATLSSGIVTFKFNPGNVGTSPDSITLNYRITVLPAKTITYL